jgi:hypothetical protein
MDQTKDNNTTNIPQSEETALCLQKGILSPSCLPISPQWLLNELLLTILRATAHIIQ